MPALWDDPVTRAPTVERRPAVPRRFEVVQVPPPGRRLDPRPDRPPRADPRRRRDAAVHARRDERDRQGAPPGRHRATSAPRSSSRTRTTSTCAPATSGSRGSAASTGSWAGTGRSSPTRAASRSSRSATCGSSTTTASRSAATSTARPTASRRSSRSRVQEALGLGRRGRLRPARLPVARRAPVVADATARTHRWAERSLAAHTRAGPGAVRDRPGRPGPGPAGERPPGSSPRSRSTASASAGSPATRRRPSATRRSTSRSRSSTTTRGRATSWASARRLDLLEAVHRGVDLFDSVLPARVARNGQLWVPGGRLNLRNAALPRRSGAGPGGLPVPPLHAGSRGPTWPICSGRRSCSRTGSRLVTTSPSP